jgi:hypothetical protein
MEPEAMRTSATAIADLVRFPQSQMPGTWERLAADLVDTRAENFRLEAENAGLRASIKALRRDEDLAKDLAAKAEAVRAECAKDLLGSVTDSQRRLTDGQR